MLLFHDPRCLDYGNAARPEQPARLRHTVPLLRQRHPEWTWRIADTANREDAALAHSPAFLDRLAVPRDFDADTPWFDDIDAHAYRASGSALAAAEAALDAAHRVPAISLMRPPGHHATADHAMGFCYLNHIAIAALHAQSRLGAERIAVWDFDAHHGNGTEAILRDRPGMLFVSVHQSPGYPGTGLTSSGNCLNFPVAPLAPRADHMATLAQSWQRVIAFEPDLVLVSAGFDAFSGDPITDMTLEPMDFAKLGTWLHDAQLPVAAVLEGGYSPELPILVDAFLTAWVGESSSG
jgi:acetoin utilization deacetylase AcuC-like enzyme